MEIRKGSFTRKTSSWHETLSRIRKVSSGGVAEKIGSTPLWRTSVHTRRERYRGGFCDTFVRIDPLEAKWVTSCSCPCVRFSGVLVHLHVPQVLHFLLTGSFDFSWIQWSPLDTSSASHSSGSYSSASTARMSSFGRDGRYCNGSTFPATPMIVCDPASACATHPELVNHLVNVFIPW